MKKAEILSVGTELLMGQVANTNAQYISKRLPEAGYGVYYHSVVGDNPERLKKSLALALERADIVIMTGGLGPTQDDLTKETVAEAFNLKLVPDEESIENIRSYFKAKGRVMVDSNLKQGYFPQGCTILKNDRGTAPGCIINEKGKIVIMLPGPPRELNPMVDNGVMPYLSRYAEKAMKSLFIRTIGIGESNIEQMLIGLVEGQTNPTVATYVKDGIVTIRITASGDTEQEASELAAEMEKKVCKILGDSVFTHKDEEIYETVFEMMKNRGLTLASAESFTGGMFSEKITSVPGSSDVFLMGAVTYSPKAKTNILNVSEKTLNETGTVSRETALEMVRGIVNVSGADVGVSFTGFAGPSGGEGRPAGNVFVAVKYGDKENVQEFFFRGERDHVRTLAVMNAFDMIRRIIG